MYAKKYVFGFLIFIAYVAVMATNYVFLSAYVHSYKAANFGQRIDAKVVELLHEPGGGFKGYKYRIEWSNQSKEIFIKSELPIDKTVKIILSPTDKNRVFLLKGKGSTLSVFNGLTGGWLISFLFILTHLFFLKLTYNMFIKIPIAYLRERIDTKANKLMQPTPKSGSAD